MGQKNHPCRSCMWQQKKERYQKMWDSRNELLAMKTQGIYFGEVGPLTGLEGGITEIMELYCEHCSLPSKYADSISDPYKLQVPQDDNFYLPQSEHIEITELFMGDN